jgi:hypothetical protein
VSISSPKLYKTESTTVAYLGYKYVLEFKKFRFSTPVLAAFNVLYNYVFDNPTEKSVPRPSASAYALLKDINIEAFGVHFKDNMQQLLLMYTSDAEETTLNDRDFILAGVIYHPSEAIDISKDATPENPPYQIDRQIIKAFEDKHKVKIPEFDRKSIVPPTLGPIAKYKEDLMERYSRTFVILKTVQNMLSPN